MNKALILALTALVGYSATAIAQTRFVRDGQPAVSSAHCLYVNDALKSRPGRYTFRTVNEALLFAQANDGKDTLWTDICIEPSSIHAIPASTAPSAIPPSSRRSSSSAMATATASATASSSRASTSAPS